MLFPILFLEPAFYSSRQLAKQTLLRVHFAGAASQVSHSPSMPTIFILVSLLREFWLMEKTSIASLLLLPALLSFPLSFLTLFLLPARLSLQDVHRTAPCRSAP